MGVHVCVVCVCVWCVCVYTVCDCLDVHYVYSMYVHMYVHTYIRRHTVHVVKKFPYRIVFVIKFYRITIVNS